MKNGNHGAGYMVSGQSAGWSVGRQLRVGDWSMGRVNWKGMDTGAFVPKAPGTAWAGKEEETLCLLSLLYKLLRNFKQRRFMILPFWRPKVGNGVAGLKCRH